MVDGFILTFNFTDDYPHFNLALQTIKKRIFENATPLTWQHLDWIAQIENALECYNLTTKEEEYPCNINITELERYCEVTRPKPEILDITKPLKTKKVNIGSEKEPKFVTIGGYWDEEIVSKVT